MNKMYTALAVTALGVVLFAGGSMVSANEIETSESVTPQAQPQMEEVQKNKKGSRGNPAWMKFRGTSHPVFGGQERGQDGQENRHSQLFKRLGDRLEGNHSEGTQDQDRQRRPRIRRFWRQSQGNRESGNKFRDYLKEQPLFQELQEKRGELSFEKRKEMRKQVKDSFPDEFKKRFQYKQNNSGQKGQKRGFRFEQEGRQNQGPNAQIGENNGNKRPFKHGGEGRRFDPEKRKEIKGEVRGKLKDAREAFRGGGQSSAQDIIERFRSWLSGFPFLNKSN